MRSEVTIVVAGDRLQIRVGTEVASLDLRAAADLKRHLEDMVRAMRAAQQPKE